MDAQPFEGGIYFLRKGDGLPDRADQCDVAHSLADGQAYIFLQGQWHRVPRPEILTDLRLHMFYRRLEEVRDALEDLVNEIQGQ